MTVHDRRRVLFLGTGNSCRSLMAEGWAKHLAAFDEVASAGIEAPGQNPHAIKVMAEAGIDITDQDSISSSSFDLSTFDLIVTVGDDADEKYPVLPAGVKKRHWPIPDPTNAVGSENEVLARFRESRDEIRDRVAGLLTEAGPEFSVLDAGIDELQRAYSAGITTVTAVTAQYVARIGKLNPMLNAVISINPDAMSIAAAVEREGDRSAPLFGVPVLIKDNIETRELPTTAGSLALINNLTGRDAPVVASLRQAGAIILGTANLSEWAYFRSRRGTSGWSAVGGQTRNPHKISHSPAGSSAGSAAAVAASMCATALGTETFGSIISPAAANGVVGFKPGIGCLSQEGVVPISHNQDVVGPFTRSVRECAQVYAALSGEDELANAATDGLLDGVKLGTLPFTFGDNEQLDSCFQSARHLMTDAGASFVDGLIPKVRPDIAKVFLTCALYEFKHNINRYLSSLANADIPRSLAGLIAFNQSHAAEELQYFGQDIFDSAEACGPLTSADYRSSEASLHGPVRRALDQLFTEHSLDVLAAPSMGPSIPIDLKNGDGEFGGGKLTGLAAIAGLPHIAIPMGRINDLPVSLSLVCPMRCEANLLKIAHRVETRLGYDYSSPV